MKAIKHIITWKTGNPTNPNETHWVFHSVKLIKNAGRFRSGQSFPTAILHTETPALILIDDKGKENLIPLSYSV